MSVKGIPYEEVRKKILSDPEVMALYLQEKRNYELQETLAAMRSRAGLTSTQVAQRMGITPPAVSKLERNAFKASLATLQRYAQACNAQLVIRAEPASA